MISLYNFFPLINTYIFLITNILFIKQITEPTHGSRPDSAASGPGLPLGITEETRPSLTLHRTSVAAAWGGITGHTPPTKETTNSPSLQHQAASVTRRYCTFFGICKAVLGSRCAYIFSKVFLLDLLVDLFSIPLCNNCIFFLYWY